MSFQIDLIDKAEYKVVIEVWEASVRATHHFLKEEDIQYFKPLILNNYLDMVELRCVRGANNQIIGFSGVAENSLEMLFIHPEQRGKGVGKALLKYAIDNFGIKLVDVNEDNQQALGFYEKYGFKVFERSALDPSGKPYPILHMRLE